MGDKPLLGVIMSSWSTESLQKSFIATYSLMFDYPDFIISVVDLIRENIIVW